MSHPKHDLGRWIEVRTTGGRVVTSAAPTGHQAGRWQVHHHGDGRTVVVDSRTEAALAAVRMAGEGEPAGEEYWFGGSGRCVRCGRDDVPLVVLAASADQVQVCGDPAGCAGAPGVVFDPAERVVRVHGQDDDGQDATVRLSMAEAGQLSWELVELLGEGNLEPEVVGALRRLHGRLAAAGPGRAPGPGDEPGEGDHGQCLRCGWHQYADDVHPCGLCGWCRDIDAAPRTHQITRPVPADLLAETAGTGAGGDGDRVVCAACGTRIEHVPDPVTGRPYWRPAGDAVRPVTPVHACRPAADAVSARQQQDCPDCGRPVTVRPGGPVPWHQRRDRPATVCPGSGEQTGGQS